MNENALSPVESVVSECSSLSSGEDSISERGESPTGDDSRKGRKSPTIDTADRQNRSVGRRDQAESPGPPLNFTQLAENQESRPPILKKIVRMRQAKREGRLLSVPNLKFAKNDPAMICDLRCEETAAPPESFTYNLMRRFSKCLKLESREKRVFCFCPFCVRACVRVHLEMSSLCARARCRVELLTREGVRELISSFLA